MNKILTVILVAAAAEVGNSQVINWRSLGEDQRNIIQFNTGYDFGVTAQLGYAKSFTIVRPVVVGLDYSFPMGSSLIDDFKVRLGGQMEIVEIGGFSTTLKIASVFRRYENALVRIASFGSDFALVAGYYTPTWSLAGEFGFDKAIASHLKHSDVMRAVFPAIKDGWYVPTGGNYYFGLQGSKTIGESLDLSLRLGATRAQEHDENAVVPLYAQLGLDLRF